MVPNPDVMCFLEKLLLKGPRPADCSADGPFCRWLCCLGRGVDTLTSRFLWCRSRIVISVLCYFLHMPSLCQSMISSLYFLGIFSSDSWGPEDMAPPTPENRDPFVGVSACTTHG